jgi:hypothetical protein
MNRQAFAEAVRTEIASLGRVDKLRVSASFLVWHIARVIMPTPVRLLLEHPEEFAGES